MSGPVIRKAYVDCDAGQLHFRYVKVLGMGELEPLVLLTGKPAGSRALEPLMAALGATRSLFAFDVPESLAAEQCGQAFSQSLTAIAIDGFHLYSDRSAVAIANALVAIQPQRCRSLFLDVGDAAPASDATALAGRLLTAVMNPS